MINSQPSTEIVIPIIKGERKFEEFVLKLLRLEWNDPDAQIFGRSGQKQHGVDILGKNNRDNLKTAGCQCKGTESHVPRIPKVADLEEEIQKAEKFDPKLDLYIIAYAGPRDAKLQNKILEHNITNEKRGQFKILLWSWDEILEKSKFHPNLYGELLIEHRFIQPNHLDPSRSSNKEKGPLVLTESIKAELVYNLSGILDKFSQFPDTSSEAPAFAKLDVWRDQIRDGNAVAVVNMISDFIANLDDGASPILRFRSYGNYGAALEQLNRMTEAITAFERAADSQPDSAGGKAYKARALFVKGLREEAFQFASDALEIDPNHRLAGAMLIEAAPKDISTAELEKRVVDICHFADIAAAISDRYSNEGLYDDALRITRRINHEGSENQKYAAIGQAILRRFENNLNLRFGVPAQDDEKKLIDEACRLLELAWSWAAKRTDKRHWVFIAANLVTAYRFNGQNEQADSLAFEAYDIEPDEAAIMERAIVAAMHRGHTEKANEIAERYGEAGTAPGALFAADVATTAHNWAKSYEWATIAFKKADNDSDRARAAELIVYSLQHTENPARALEESETLRAEFSLNIGFETRVIETAFRSGNQAVLDATRTRLNHFDFQKLNPLQCFELANTFANLGEWERASDLLDGLYDLNRPSEPLRQRLFYLYRADLRRKARELFETLGGDALKAPDILRLGAAIYEKAGLLPRAISLLDRSLEININDLRSRLDWIILCVRNNEEGRAKTWVKNAAVDYKSDAHELMELAQCFDRYGRRKEAIQLAYDTLRKNWGKDERIHRMYMSLFFGRTEKDKFLNCKSVDENTVFVLKNEHGQERKYRIEESPLLDSINVPPTSQLALLMVGKIVGDQISFNESIGQSEIWTITGIEHKFLDLLHNVLEHHSALFPNSGTIGRFRIDPDKKETFEPMFEMVRARAKTAERVIDSYKSNFITVDNIGQMLGLDVVDALLGLLYRDKIILDVCNGDFEERKQATEHLSGADRILVDPGTLALWNQIDLLTEISSMEAVQICVVQATLDLFNARREEAQRTAKQKGGLIQARGEHIVFDEPTKEQHKATIDKAVELIKWCQRCAIILPTEPVNVSDTVIDLYSKPIRDTLGTLAANDIVGIFDDRRLRAVATELGPVKTGWTQALLMQWLSEKKLSRPTYSKIIAKLSRAKAGFISVGSEDLRSALISDDLDQFKDLLSALAIPIIDGSTLIGVVSDFIINLWPDSLYQDRRCALTGQVYEVMLNRTDGIDIFYKTLNIVGLEFYKISNPYNFLFTDWKKYTEIFKIGHFINKHY
jgi:tetratricopeptide (TPR) repeat protein